MTATPTFTVEDHIRLRRVGAMAASPDGRWLAVAVQRLDRDGVKYVADLWKVPTDGGEPMQLTRGECNDAAPCFRHDGALGFLSNRQPTDVKPDEDADKRMQVWLLPTTGGEPVQLTDEPLGIEEFRFAAKADRLLALAPVLPDVEHGKQRETAAERAKKGPSLRTFKRQPVRHWDHWLHQDTDRASTHLLLMTAGGQDRVDLTPEAAGELDIDPAFAITADGRRAAFTWRTAGTDREDDYTMVLLDLQTRQRIVLPQAPCSNSEMPHFSPDGRQLAFVRSTRSARDVVRPVLVVADENGATRELARAWDRWPMPWDWSADGRQLFVTADDAGVLPVFAVDVASGDVQRLTAGAGAHSGVVALPQGGFACSRSTLLDAPECHVHDGRPDSAPRPLARLSGFEPATAWAETESITTLSDDGTPIQSWITRPKNAAAPSPVLLWIHGGPIGMSGDGWHWRWNSLLAVAQGYTVVQPNPRGSTGFGQQFIQGIWGNVWGGQCYRDLMAVTDALEKRADVDPTRIMAMGGSFGGYMTNWIGTQTQRFRCLITHASIVTMANFTGTTDHPAWWYLEMGGENPYAQPDAYDRYAPIRHIANWKTPVLILHGEKDYRCPVGEGLNLFEALQYHGVESELAIFPDENHWILKPRNVVAWYEQVLGFLGKHMQAH
ncbi:alpha/beta hydrolase family protein [Ramlibacter algicola]|uniref:S9 family peptidase n=1 Tax=Ramlibacter algicola TaxID=2795217 RepID=A0A934Q045_9BURK|nr:S9 family peptidase [Ramlibacter algicola]MBK0392326.1 S9 family peptidase [Ramlibacter algicola]